MDLADIVVRQEGALVSIFNYGSVTLHPREGKFLFEIMTVPSPGRVQNMLLEHRERARSSRELQGKDEVFRRLIKLLPEYSEAELTLLYQKVHSQLLRLANDVGENQKKVI